MGLPPAGQQQAAAGAMPLPLLAPPGVHPPASTMPSAGSAKPSISRTSPLASRPAAPPASPASPSDSGAAAAAAPAAASSSPSTRGEAAAAAVVPSESGRSMLSYTLGLLASLPPVLPRGGRGRRRRGCGGEFGKAPLLLCRWCCCFRAALKWLVRMPERLGASGLPLSCCSKRPIACTQRLSTDGGVAITIGCPTSRWLDQTLASRPSFPDNPASRNPACAHESSRPALQRHCRLRSALSRASSRDPASCTNWAAIRERSAPCSFAPVTWPNRTEGRLRAESLQRLAQNPCMALSALPLPGLHPAPSATQPPCQMHRAMQGRTAAQGPRRRARAWRRRRRRPCLVCSRRPRRRRGCRGRHLPRSRLRHHGPHLGQPEGPHGLRHHR